MNGSKDYSRFFMPMRGMDESVEHPHGQDTTPGVCQLAPFLYRGSDDWPFKYSIPDNKGGKE
jgi:hypothetical protein